ncbi:MAG: hypothetical protein PVI33_04495 [Candidatus Omnitrophota bacterium]|jgi:hypothetical protein
MMRGRSIVFFAGLMILCLLSCNVLAEDAKTFMEGFYAELADIIERNMNDPDKCVTEVKRFYEDNQSKLSQFMEEAKIIAASEGTSIEEQARSMTKEEVEEMMQQTGTNRLFQIMSRFNQVMALFSRNYPQQALEIMESLRHILQ